MRQDLIDRVRKGEAWIHYGQGEHGTLEQLVSVLRKAFSNGVMTMGVSNYYHVSPLDSTRWHYSDINPVNMPLIKVSEFFPSEPKVQRAKILSEKTESYQYSSTEHYSAFWHNPFTPCEESDVPQAVVESLRVNPNQVIMIDGFIYKL